MLLRLSKKEEIETLTRISILAFHFDYLIGLDENDGPPDYDSFSWHTKMFNDNHLYSYIDDNNIIGGAVLFKYSFTLYIGRIFIDPSYHHQGYGLKMMRNIELLFNDIDIIKLDTPLNNIRTNSFYLKLGFKKDKVDDNTISYIKYIR